MDKLIDFLNKSFVDFLVEHKDVKERVELIRKKHNIGDNFFGINRINVKTTRNIAKCVVTFSNKNPLSIRYILEYKCVGKFI